MARSIRSRLARLSDLRHLTDAEAKALLADPGLVANGPVRWSLVGSPENPTQVRTTLRVYNTYGENLRLFGRIALAVPHCSHWGLVWGLKDAGEHPAPLRRLDLRDDHRNPDGEEWNDRTHKHRWSAADGNAWAYTPDDIPHDRTPGSVGPDDYRAIFEAFAAECAVDLGPDYGWGDPPLSLPAQPDLWEVP